VVKDSLGVVNYEKNESLPTVADGSLQQNCLRKMKFGISTKKQEYFYNVMTLADR